MNLNYTFTLVCIVQYLKNMNSNLTFDCNRDRTQNIEFRIQKIFILFYFILSFVCRFGLDIHIVCSAVSFVMFNACHVCNER